MTIGILGSGRVAQLLGTALITEQREEVKLGTRNISSPDIISWLHNNPTGTAGSFQEAAAYGESVILAVKGAKVMEVIALADHANFRGKTVIDVTNPITDGVPPVNGVLPFFTDHTESLMERIQNYIPEAKVVKAFNSVGADLMYKPAMNDGWPTMFICGNDADAKMVVTDILTSFGWDAEDMGMAEAARAIEPLCMLWCIPGFLRNNWNHAFRLVRP